MEEEEEEEEGSEVSQGHCQQDNTAAQSRVSWWTRLLCSVVTFSCDGVHKEDCQQIWERKTLSEQLIDELWQQAFFFSILSLILLNHKDCSTLMQTKPDSWAIMWVIIKVINRRTPEMEKSCS